MPNNIAENNFIKFSSNLTKTIRKLSLYPVGHPAIASSIKDLYSTLKAILNIKDSFGIGLSSDSQILIEGNPISEKDSRLIEGLIEYFKKMGIESLTFDSRITDKELEDFLRILLIEPEEIKKIGGLNKLFLDKNIKHIKIAQFSYVKIHKDKAVLEVDKEKKETWEKLKSRVKEYSKDKIKKPEDILSLERDIIDTVTAEFKDRKKLSSRMTNMLKKFFLKSDDREGFISRLSDSLLNSGCLKQEIDELINKIGKAISNKITAAMQLAGVGVEEVEQLRKENEELKFKISQLQKDEKRTTQEKERIDNVVHHMAEGLVVVDPQGKVLMLNPVAEKLLGVSKEAVGASLSNVVKNEHLLTMVKNINPDKEGKIQKDIELLSPDESTKRVLRTSSAVVEDPDGKTVGMVTILNDITRQKEVEKMKSDFVANVTHELKTPLATVQQNISLLLQGIAGKLNEDQTKFLNLSQDNMKRLKRLISDLLDRAAIEAGKFKLKLSKAGVNGIINNVVDFLNKWAQSKNLSIQVALLREDEQLNIDKDRIEQVLTNLFSNAIKFTPQSGKISISAIKKEPTDQFPQGVVEVSVRDNGGGIAPDDLERIFKRFEQVSDSTSNIGGTGLGLSICEEIVKMHGGKIWVESKLNEGSRFCFLLPREKEQVSPKEG